MKKNKRPSAPPTVLVITLEADGSGSLLARRGELAHLSQFTYSGLPEIIEAIQQGALDLMAVEQNPPALDMPTTPPESAADDESAVEEAADEGEPPAEEADEQATPEPVEAYADPVTPSSPQLTLI